MRQRRSAVSVRKYEKAVQDLTDAAKERSVRRRSMASRSSTPAATATTTTT